MSTTDRRWTKNNRRMRRATLVTTLFTLSWASMQVAEAGERDKDPQYPNVHPPLVQFGSYGTETDSINAPRGVAFERDGAVLVADCARDRVDRWSASGGHVHTAGFTGLNCPSGLAVDRLGDVYVVDSGNGAVKRFGPDGTLEKVIASNLNRPNDVAVSNERVVVANTGASTIETYDVSGAHLGTFGGPGSGPGMFAEPSGVALSAAGEIFVADKYNHRVAVFSPEGRLLRTFGKFGSYPGDLAGPADLAFGGGQLFVADSVNHRMQVFATDGRLLYQFGRHPSAMHEGHGRTHYPLVVAAMEDGGRVAVCEKFEGRCQVFDTSEVADKYVPTGDAWWDKYPYFHYRTHGGRGTTKSLTVPWETDPDDLVAPNDGGSGREVLIMAEEDMHRVSIMAIGRTSGRTVLSFGSYGSGPGEMNLPQGAVLDHQDRIWVSDSLNHRLQLFDLKGAFIRAIGSAGGGELQFREPGAVAIDGRGNVYVPDSSNNRVVVLDQDGNFTRSWGSPGNGPGQLNHPIGLALNAEGTEVFTVELFNPRIQVFSPDGTFKRSFGTRGVGPGQLIMPMKVTVTDENFAFVTDDALSRVNKYRTNGEYVKSWGVRGSEPGQFFNPQGIAEDGLDRLWVIDYGNHRGQVFTPDGDYLMTFGEDVIGVASAGGAPIQERLGVAAGVGAVGFSIVGLRRRGRHRSRSAARTPPGANPEIPGRS